MIWQTRYCESTLTTVTPPPGSTVTQEQDGSTVVSSEYDQTNPDGTMEADLASKQKALEKLAPAQGQLHRFQPENELLRFLAAL
jgi:hypothetical protein